MASQAPDALPCAELTRAEAVDPIGTAGFISRVLAVEVPLPWPRDMSEHPDLGPLAPVLRAAGARLQALVPTSLSRERGSGATRRVLDFALPPGPFQAYSRMEHVVEGDDLTQALMDIVGLATDRQQARAAPSQRSGPTDVLICSHGRRDQCCGTLGTRLAGEVGDPADAGTGAADRGSGWGDRVRVWRTSHTGGHRFAPTALVLPEGTAWGYLDAERLAGIVDRSLDVTVAASLYRGCTGLGAPAIQACDREGFKALGWSWFDHHRQGEVVEESDGQALVRLSHTGPRGAAGSYEAVVGVRRTLPIPECRKPLTASRKQADELEVLSFRSL